MSEMYSKIQSQIDFLQELQCGYRVPSPPTKQHAVEPKPARAKKQMSQRQLEVLEQGRLARLQKLQSKNAPVPEATPAPIKKVAVRAAPTARVKSAPIAIVKRPPLVYF